MCISLEIEKKYLKDKWQHKNCNKNIKLLIWINLYWGLRQYAIIMHNSFRSLLNFQYNLTFPYLVIDKIYWSLMLLWPTITVSCCSFEKWVFPCSFHLLLTIHHWKYQKKILKSNQKLIPRFYYLSPWILHRKFDDEKCDYLTEDWIFCGLPYRWQTRMKRKF